MNGFGYIIPDENVVFSMLKGIYLLGPHKTELTEKLIGISSIPLYIKPSLSNHVSNTPTPLMAIMVFSYPPLKGAHELFTC